MPLPRVFAAVILTAASFVWISKKGNTLTKLAGIGFGIAALFMWLPLLQD